MKFLLTTFYRNNFIAGQLDLRSVKLISNFHSRQVEPFALNTYTLPADYEA